VATCSACGGQVQPGSLRCRHCGAPFDGPDRKLRLQPSVRIGAGLRMTEDGLEVEGYGMTFSFEPGDD